MATLMARRRRASDQRRAHLESAVTIQPKSVGPPGDDVEHPLHPLSLPRVSHRRAILDVVNSFSGPVEVATVLAELERIGYPFKAQNRKVMVGSALGKLARRRKNTAREKGRRELAPHLQALGGEGLGKSGGFGSWVM